MKLSTITLAITAHLVSVMAQAGDPEVWGNYAHCPTVPVSDCAYICSNPSQPVCQTNDVTGPRVSCYLCPTTGDSCPASYNSSCNYLCPDASNPSIRMCVKELTAPDIACAGCPGAPGVPVANSTTTATTALPTYNPIANGTSTTSLPEPTYSSGAGRSNLGIPIVVGAVALFFVS